MKPSTGAFNLRYSGLKNWPGTSGLSDSRPRHMKSLTGTLSRLYHHRRISGCVSLLSP
jgi:hypothetical protein